MHEEEVSPKQAPLTGLPPPFPPIHTKSLGKMKRMIGITFSFRHKAILIFLCSGLYMTHVQCTSEKRKCMLFNMHAAGK